MAIKRHFARGFTLIEMISVIVIIGIVAIFAVPRFGEVDVFESRGFFEEALAATRYAHKLAVASGCSIQVSFDAAADSYTISRWTGGADCTIRTNPLATVARPGSSDPFTGAAPGSVDVSTSLTFFFDRVGRPRSSGGALITNPASLQVGIDGRQIRIAPETGLVTGG